MSRPTVTWRVLALALPMDGQGEVDPGELRRAALERAGVAPERLRGLRVARRALDLRGRKKGRAPLLVHHVDLVLDAGHRPPGLARALATH